MPDRLRGGSRLIHLQWQEQSLDQLAPTFGFQKTSEWLSSSVPHFVPVAADAGGVEVAKIGRCEMDFPISNRQRSLILMGPP